MSKLKKISNTAIVLLFFVIFLLISIYDGGTMINRGIRLFPNIVALGFILLSYKLASHKFILGFLSCLLLSALCAFYYETFIFRELTLAFNLLGYIFLGFAVIPKLNKIKAGWFLGIYFGICLVFWGYTLFELTEISKNQLASTFHYVLMNLNNLGLIFILSSALLFVHEKPTKIALTFLSFVIVYILSEVIRGASYYSPNRVELFFYGCRILYALAMALIIYCCGLIHAEKKVKDLKIARLS